MKKAILYILYMIYPMVVLMMMLNPSFEGFAQIEEHPSYQYLERPALEVPVWSENDEEWEWDWETLDSIVVVDTIRDSIYISNLEDVTRYFGISFDEYVRRFMMFKDEQDSSRTVSTEQIYLNYFLPMLQAESDFMSKRLVSKEFVLMQEGDYTNLRLKEYPMNYYYRLEGMPLDVMLTSYGTESTDIFLQSPYAQQTTIEQLFATIHFTRNRTLKGINFYFPDYSFKHKREMAQFAKSVSLVTDSSRIEGLRGLKLYLTFDRKAGMENWDFLCCLTQMADSIFLIDQQPELNTIPVMDVIDDADAESLSIFSKIRNQMYLARFSYEEFPETSAVEFRLSDVRAIMMSDYDDNNWETFLLILIVIFIVIFVLVLGYFYSSVISYQINKNMDYIYALLILLVLEIYLLSFIMIENMSKDNIFTFGGDNQKPILFMPLLFIFIIPIMKSIRNRRNLP